MIEEAIETMNEISKLIEDRFGKNNKAYIDTSTKKSRLVLILSRRSGQSMLREKHLSNSQYVVIKDAGYSTLNDRIRKDNEKQLTVTKKKRSMQNLNRSSGSQKDLKKINQRASMLIERSVNMPGNLIPIRSSDVRLRSAYGLKTKKVSARKSVRPKRNNWLQNSDKMVYMPFPGYEYKVKRGKKGKTNRYANKNMFNPISPFTQKPTNQVIHTNNSNQNRNYFNNYLAHNSINEAQRQLMEYSGLLNQEMTMNLLNRPLNDDEIRQIIKHRVAQTIDAVEEAKREYILTHSPQSEMINDRTTHSYDIVNRKSLMFV